MNSSSLIGGTPGKQNSIFNPNFIPLVKSVSHDPLIPKSTDSVVVKLDIDNKKRFDDIEPKAALEVMVEATILIRPQWT